MKTVNNTKLSQEVAQKVLDLYQSLPNKGKAKDGEYTVLAGVVMEVRQSSMSNNNNKANKQEFNSETPSILAPTSVSASEAYHLSVISLGTGTKCLGQQDARKDINGCIMQK